MYIRKLKDTGIGRTCLLIGGGMSVKDFEFNNVDEGVCRVAVNNSFPDGVRIDYLIYNDANFIPVLMEKRLWEKAEVIAFVNNYCNVSKYHYHPHDLGMISENFNTGVKAVHLLKTIFNFDEIYLIGFDFDTHVIDGEVRSHFYKEEIGHNKKYGTGTQYNDHLGRLKKMVTEFEVIKDREGIYNCNPKSRLKIFPYGLPWENKKIA